MTTSIGACRLKLNATTPWHWVMHQKFGPGNVITTDGDKLDIKLDKAGRKKVMDSFVEKAE
jgi:DNA helicase II / ATP-dependent DNA helicase PcrA